MYLTEEQLPSGVARPRDKLFHHHGRFRRTAHTRMIDDGCQKFPLPRNAENLLEPEENKQDTNAFVVDSVYQFARSWNRRGAFCLRQTWRQNEATENVLDDWSPWFWVDADQLHLQLRLGGEETREEKFFRFQLIRKRPSLIKNRCCWPIGPRNSPYRRISD